MVTQLRDRLMITPLDRIVRAQAFKAIDMFVKRTEHLTANMADTVLPSGEQETGGQAVAANRGQPGIAVSAGGAAVALAGWAFTSLSSRLGATDLSTPMLERRASTQSVNGTAEAPASAFRVNAVNTASVSAAQVRSNSQPNLHASTSSLRASAMPGGIGFDFIAPSLARASLSSAGFGETDGEDATDDWGGDLMDVQADEGDFDEFESAQLAPTAIQNEPIVHPRFTITKSVPPKPGAGKGNAMKTGSSRGGLSKLGGASRTASVLREIEADEDGPEWSFEGAAGGNIDANGEEVKADDLDQAAAGGDTARTGTPPPLSTSHTDGSTTSSPKSATGKDKLAQMKEARQARLAAARDKKAGVLGAKKL